MSKPRAAQLITVFILLAAVAIAWFRLKYAHTVSEAPTPQDTIYAMLNAARTGDVKPYLSTYTGPMESNLRHALSEKTETEFAKYLRDSTTEVKGIAVSDPQRISDAEVRVQVEYVYQDRNEVQTMYLQYGPKGWKISRTDGDERVKTLVPYGTPVR